MGSICLLPIYEETNNRVASGDNRKEKITMLIDVQQTPVKDTTTEGSWVVGFIRQHPLASYFLLAFGFTWGWQIPLFAIRHQPILGPWVILSPVLAGLVMAGVTEGRAGMASLLRRVMLWRVGRRWYLVALLISPAVWLVSVALMPGAAAAVRAPSPSFLLIWVAGFGFTFKFSTFVEEAVWRGFALPRLQTRCGPLVGLLILGALHALWQLLGWAFFSSATGAGISYFSFTVAVTFLGFVCEKVYACQRTAHS